MKSPKQSDQDWVGLSEASHMVGVSPATLRRWSDAGRVRVFTTPGGHRRFSRSALQRLLPADRGRRPALGTAGLTPARIVQSYRRAKRETARALPWVLALSDEQRTLFRERGHVLATGLLQYLDATQPETAGHHLKLAAIEAAEYGRMAAGLSLSLSQTVEGFLRFRAPFFHELVLAARRRGFGTSETTELIELAERGMDQMLVATMSGHSVRSVTGSGRRARPASRQDNEATGPR